MKSCPTCNRTFDDQMSFCLVDGSILCAPFDHRATADRREDSQTPTRILNQAATEPQIPEPTAAPNQTAQAPETTQAAHTPETVQPAPSLEPTRSVNIPPTTATPAEIAQATARETAPSSAADS